MKQTRGGQGSWRVIVNDLLYAETSTEEKAVAIAESYAAAVTVHSLVGQRSIEVVQVLRRWSINDVGQLEEENPPI